MNSLADLLQQQPGMSQAQPSGMPQSPQSVFALIQKLIGLGVPRQMVPMMVQKLLSQGQSDSAMPNRNLMTDPGAAMSRGQAQNFMPQTAIPNVYRGAPEFGLPPRSPGIYPDWQTKI